MYICIQELVSFQRPHVQNLRLQDEFENKCQMYLEPPYDEMIAARIGYIVQHCYMYTHHKCTCPWCL